jgi:hypothetical protein
MEGYYRLEIDVIEGYLHLNEARGTTGRSTTSENI